MVRAYLSIGSNIKPRQHIRGALSKLEALYGCLLISPVYESRAVGFEGENFLNLAAGFDTDEDVHAINRSLALIEKEHGRKRDGNRFNSRTLDLDLLLYGDLIIQENSLPRDEILKYAFVLQPLADIAPLERHPQTGERYADLWARFDSSKQTLWKVDF